MKILIESYEKVMQNPSGGIAVRIDKFTENLKIKNINYKLFDKWNDKVSDYDILHIFKANIDNYDLISYAKQLNKKIIISSVIPMENELKIYISRAINKIVPVKNTYVILKDILDMADLIIAQTEKESKFISKYYSINPNKIRIIPNGINISYDNVDMNEFYRRTNVEGRFVLQVGRFDKNKNQLNVIKAMKNTNIPIVFIGGEDPSEKDYYKECINNADDNIHFLGWINHNDPLLKSAYKNAHVVILPSYKEIFGNSLIEGGASGANLVATKELPINEWGIDSICKTIDPNNLDDIRGKIIEAYESDLNIHTSNTIESLFSWENVINKYIENYKLVLDKD